jgi:small neutral amino acid transporter SnatA (MarC family)
MAQQAKSSHAWRKTRPVSNWRGHRDAIAKASFAMNFAVIDAGLAIKLLLLLLIGMGPKVALVPFLERTKHLDAETQRAVGRRMVVTGVATAIVLFATGWFLLRLLHISGGAVAVGGAIVLAIRAINMAAGPTKTVEEVVEIPEDPKQIAVYPLAVPYLLNPVGITVLIIASGEIVSVASAALVLGLVLLVGAFDYLVFANIDTLSKRLSPVGLVISEVVFGILLTAVAVQLMVYGLGALGIISAAAH